MDEKDYVYQELARALQKKKHVIPVLVSGAKMFNANQVPEGLANLCIVNAQEIDSGKHFRSGLGSLVQQIVRLTGLDMHDYPAAVRNCREVELTATWLGLMSTNPEVVAEIRTAKNLTMVMNDGRGFLDAMRETIRGRYTDPDKFTRVATLHPRSRFLSF